MKIDQWVEGNQDLVNSIINKNGEILEQLIVRSSFARETGWPAAESQAVQRVLRNYITHFNAATRAIASEHAPESTDDQG